MKRFGGVLVLAALAAALPTEAAADIRFRGQSGQERLVTMRTGDDGMLERFGINYAAPCRRPGFAFRDNTWFRPSFDEVTRDRFVDAGTTRGPIEDGMRAVARLRTSGRRVSEHRWKGIFRVSVRVLRGGRLIDRCYKRTRWRVLRRD